MDDRTRLRALGPPSPAAGGLELRHLRAFVVTAQVRHFGRAAARLHLSQPALSRQVATLERLVGCRLLHRSPHHVDLTPAGAVLLASARQIVDDVERAVTSSRAVQDGGGGAGVGGAGPDAATLARATRPLLVALESGLGVDALRSAFEGMMAGFPLPRDATVRPMQAGGVPGLVVGESGSGSASPSVLHLHGGGYVMGSAYGYRPLAGALAAAVHGDVLVPDYRLVPEHAYPAALTDTVEVYRWLVDRRGPDGLVVMGDSAGAGLALSLLLSLHHLDLPAPTCAVLLSPWIDPAPGASSAGEVAPSRWVSEFAARHGHLVDLDAAAVNPLVTEPVGLPPVLMQVGDREPCAVQARELAARLTRHGVDVALETYPASTHVFHHAWSFLAPAADAVDGIGRFVAGRTSGELAG